MKGIDIALKIAEKKRKIFENYRELAVKLKKAFREVLEDDDVRVIVFGSVVRGDYSILSDLDVLVVSEKADKVRYGEVLEEVERIVGQLVGVEIHLVTPEVFEKWYRKFIDSYEEF
ncbi:DNA polymerase beta domain protein region [Ferroglobus placidus DSM 10642]|uniref:DNA polymerase beta domain protein region n=1 Tax=Ferroglobus placidus (strain DSM 10642 / AEDII12DO) TaxID=589924 RepID=D3RY30_FERPA|nr:nucleotidyltransferase domain-containing protein [Ferroglobus placidus]ADC65393.1 DNA polymerase beta domain protein region [Ferroglobus placidus DSM 10642]